VAYSLKKKTAWRQHDKSDRQPDQAYQNLKLNCHFGLLRLLDKNHRYDQDEYI